MVRKEATRGIIKSKVVVDTTVPQLWNDWAHSVLTPLEGLGPRTHSQKQRQPVPEIMVTSAGFLGTCEAKFPSGLENNALGNWHDVGDIPMIFLIHMDWNCFVSSFLDKLVQFLGDAGLKLNAGKNCVDHNRSSTTTVFDYLDWSRDQGKGKGIRSQMVGLHVIFAGSKSGALDIDYHLQSANSAFFANKSIFLSRNVSIRNKLKIFDAIVTPIACFGAGPRCIRAADMDKFDIHFRRMIRCVVGAPAGICWHDPWHKILHIWNQRVREMVEVCHMKTWAETCASQQWKFAGYIMSLPCERWVRRMLHWQPIGRGPVGRPAMNWTSKFEQFSRIKRWDDWTNVAMDADHWMMEMDEFVKFCTK